MREYKGEKNQIWFEIDDDGDNLEGFEAIKRYIEEFLCPISVKLIYGWDTSIIEFTKDGVKAKIEYSNWFGIQLIVDARLDERSMQLARSWAQTMIEIINKKQ